MDASIPLAESGALSVLATIAPSQSTAAVREGALRMGASSAITIGNRSALALLDLGRRLLG